jgi:SMODS-associated NUDIX domain
MRTFILKMLLGTILLFFGIKTNSSLQSEFIASGIIFLLATIIVDGGEHIIFNFGRFIFVLHSKILAIGGKYIRFSMSYQYRIKVNDKYLIVKNSNPNYHWYQFVGGKYKRIEESNKILQDFEATDDLKMKTIGLKKGDLAVFVPAKNAINFLDWFNSKNDREISHWREFYEELVGGKEEPVLSYKNFPYINYKFVKSVITPIKRAPIDSGWNCWEFLQYDVLDLIPTPEQQVELEELFNKGETEYIKWASPALIDRLGHDDDEQQRRYSIGAHTKWVLNLKWSKI